MKRVSGKNTTWTPGESDIACSEHFVDGPLTAENSDPTWKLRYIAGVKKQRKVLVCQIELPATDPVEELNSSVSMDVILLRSHPVQAV